MKLKQATFSDGFYLIVVSLGKATGTTAWLRMSCGLARVENMRVNIGHFGREQNSLQF